MSSVPKQKPGRSKQDYATPDEFIAAVKAKFGVKEFSCDLAADQHNTKSRCWISADINSLQQDWGSWAGDLWLNPPYSDIEPWARKCTQYNAGVGRIFLLVPASVGANWYAEHVQDIASVYFLSPRLSFDGKNPYPKDCMLLVYELFTQTPRCWRWRP